MDRAAIPRHRGSGAGGATGAARKGRAGQPARLFLRLRAAGGKSSIFERHPQLIRRWLACWISPTAYSLFRLIFQTIYWVPFGESMAAGDAPWLALTSRSVSLKVKSHTSIKKTALGPCSRVCRPAIIHVPNTTNHFGGVSGLTLAWAQHPARREEIHVGRLAAGA